MSVPNTSFMSEESTVKHFFVSGLPRSRTAWLANFLTTDKSLCFHDGLKYCRKVEDLTEVFKRSDKEFVGDSDSALVLFYHRIQALFPDSPWVLVYRNFKDCADSALRLSFAGEDTESILIDGAARLAVIRLAELELKSPNVLIVDYDELDNSKVIRSIVNHVTPGVLFDEERFKLLDGLHTQIHESKYLVSVAEGLTSTIND